MIQINLLPDVKQQLISARRTRNTVISISILAAMIAGGIVALMLILLGVQATRNGIADSDIKKEFAKLSAVDDLSDMVTIQNQLTKINGLNDNKSMDSRVFAVLQVINPAEPNNVQFTNVTITPEENKLVLEGKTASYSALEALEKTIHNTKLSYATKDDSTQKSEDLATDVVVLQRNFGEDSDGSKVVTFQMEVTYHDLLFSNAAKNVKIEGAAQKIDVTDSRVRVPESLFGTPVETEGGQ